MHKLTVPSLFVLAALAAAPAHAGSYDKIFFVKAGGTAQSMWADRDACSKIAEQVGLQRGGEAYSDPDYGMISAMGAALESDSMQSYGKVVRRAALAKCMEKRGWTQADPSDADEKAVRHANAKSPEALDNWIKANAPAAHAAPAATVQAAANEAAARGTPVPAAPPAQAVPVTAQAAATPGLPPPPAAIVPVSATKPQN
jgi:hypothetical protein